MLGIPIANRVEAANMSDRRAAARLLGSLAPNLSDDQNGHRRCQAPNRKLTRLIKSRGLRASYRQTPFRGFSFLVHELDSGGSQASIDRRIHSDDAVSAVREI
jgi:hypothetical protein